MKWRIMMCINNMDYDKCNPMEQNGNNNLQLCCSLS